jgi:RimJ/RimL family protein N-acetyltransferase
LPIRVPELTTPRLVLRPLTKEEARAVRSGGTLPGLRFDDDYPLPDTYDGLGLFLRHGDERWGFSLVVRQDDRGVVGEIGFVGPPSDGAVMIGYAIVPSARRQGYATEAIGALSDWALAQAEVGEVRAQTLPANEASMRALLRAGFEETYGNEKLRRFRRVG